MSKTELTNDILDLLRSLTGDLNRLSANIQTFIQELDNEPSAADSEPALTEAMETAAPTPEPKTLTLEQVRAVLVDKSRQGHTDEIRSLLEAHGAAKLSEIDPAEYAMLLVEAEVLGNE